MVAEGDRNMWVWSINNHKGICWFFFIKFALMQCMEQVKSVEKNICSSKRKWRVEDSHHSRVDKSV
jgi:hypothetical protein